MINSERTNLQTLYFPKRLSAVFANIKNYPLTIIEAPAGFGKTTALDLFFSDEYFKTVQVYRRTLFGGGLAGIWNGFCEIIGKTDNVSAAELVRVGLPTEANAAYAAEIMCEIECEKETYIVFDNFESTEELNIFLTLISHCENKNLHIVLAMRQIPAVNRSGLFMSNKIYFIGGTEFVFSKEDIKEYFKNAGITLVPDELDKVCSITDGWIFAVYLQLLFYARNGYFKTEILNSLIENAFFGRLSEEEKDFYLALSAFKSFTVRQAMFVSGKTAEFVKSKIENNGFVHYDENRRRYYFHSLLLEYIKNVFAELSDEKQNEIYLKGGLWEEKSGEKIAAVKLYQKANAYENIFAMPRTSYDLADIEDKYTYDTIIDILENTPCEVKLKYPESLITLAFTLFFINENEKLASYIPQVCDIIERSDISAERKNACFGEVELLISFLQYNRIDEMSAHHKKAYELLGHKSSIMNLKSTWTFGSPSVLCLYHREVGGLERELALMDECMPIYYKLTGGHGSGAEYMMRAEAEFMRGNIDIAETYAYRAMFAAESKKQNSVYQCGLFLLANIAMQKGNEETLSDIIFDMSEKSAENKEDLCRYTLDLFLGYIYSVTGRTDKTAEWLANGDINENRVALMAMPFAHMIYAKILLEQREYTKLFAFCPFADEIAGIFPNIVPQIYYKIYSACAYCETGEKEKACAELKTALDTALPDKLYMPFVHNYLKLEPVFKEVGKVGEICALGESFKKSLKLFEKKKPQLSPREKEVADLIVQGFTNKQIAERLYVSISTVKMTVSSIFEKTGIESRVQLKENYRKEGAAR